MQGRTFLHNYDWKADKDFATLELILTAPVVVASWINLQYYGSTVAPLAFGGGNKLIHNVVGGIGVVQGNGGILRPGLPWQTLHDGDTLMHDPLRLSVMIEAPNAGDLGHPGKAPRCARAVRQWLAASVRFGGWQGRRALLSGTGLGRVRRVGQGRLSLAARRHAALYGRREDGDD